MICSKYLALGTVHERELPANHSRVFGDDLGRESRFVSFLSEAAEEAFVQVLCTVPILQFCYEVSRSGCSSSAELNRKFKNDRKAPASLAAVKQNATCPTRVSPKANRN